MSIQILDVYSSNRADFAKEKATGTDGVILKGGQGEWPDVPRVHPEWIAQLDDLQMPWGWYWQMDARFSPEKHKAAIKKVRDTQGFGTLGLWLACELPFYPMTDFLYRRLPYAGWKMIESVWRGLDYPGIYTSVSKWNLIFAGMPKALQDEFAARSPLWVAQYKVTKPALIGAWEDRWTFWQYQENPDYSIWNGTEAEYANRFLSGEASGTTTTNAPGSYEYNRGYNDAVQDASIAVQELLK